MEQLWLRLLLITFVAALINLVLSQTCNERYYTVIDNPKRSVSYSYNSAIDGEALCDRRLDEAKWYRFSSSIGDTIVERAPNDPVPTQRCGTYAPIYIKGLGSHPSSDFTIVSATVCVHWNGNACQWMGTINIYRCPVRGDSSHYFLYKLWVPGVYFLSYCVGWLAPFNQASSTSITTTTRTTTATTTRTTSSSTPETNQHTITTTHTVSQSTETPTTDDNSNKGSGYSDSQRLIIWIPLALLIAIIIVNAVVVVFILIKKYRKRNRLAEDGGSSTNRTNQSPSPVDVYASLKQPETSTEDRTYDELQLYETIREETQQNAK